MDRRAIARRRLSWIVPLLALGFVGAAALPIAAATVAHPTGEAATHLPPHPLPVVAKSPGPSPALHTTHYWAGAYYTGSNTSVHQLSTTITTPDAYPSTSEFYYVLLSVWDSASSYDQVGFTNDGGVWGWTYSYTSACAGTYYYNPDTYNLARGTTYTFTMNISSSGDVVFSVSQGGVYLDTITGHTGGTYFVDDGFYSCSSVSYYDLTDYEEIYDSVQKMPSFNYVFDNTTGSNASIASWSSMGSPPGGGTIAISTGVIDVVNEHFTVSFLSGGDARTFAAGTTSFTTNLSVLKVLRTGTVSLKLTGPTTVFSATFSPSSGTPGFTSKVTVSISSPKANVPYKLTLEGVTSTGVFTYVTLVVTVA